MMGASVKSPWPFWMSLGMVPLLALAAARGGAWWMIVPAYAWYLVTVLDGILGRDTENPDPTTPDTALNWHRAITLIWPPVQALCLYGLIYYTTRAPLSGAEKLGLFFAMGVMSGSVGIVYAHELMHQRNRMERDLADLLLAMVGYSHFRSEHLLVHHSYVGTPRDAVTARYNEGFFRYFARVLRDCPRSAWVAEVALLARSGRPAKDARNPFWRYAALQFLAVLLALMLGGVEGVILFAVQAFVAVWQLELTNYVEHYGLTRQYLGGGRYERVMPHHSWNATHKVSNWLLINLQRHSDHHTRPDRRFPLLQTNDTAPELPMGYPAMTFVAMIPPLWRRRMNPRVRDWRRRHYPDITDWGPYNRGETPMPKGAP